MTITLVVLAYLACCFGAWGLTLGHFTKRFPYFSNIAAAVSLCWLGPMSLIVVAACSMLDGGLAWRVVPMTKAEIRAAHLAKWPTLTDESEWA